MSRNRETVDRQESSAGLFLRGELAGRRKFDFPNEKTGEVRVRIIYYVKTDGPRVQCDRWFNSVEDFHKAVHPTLGEQVEFAVVIRCFSTKGGGANYSLTMRDSEERGESF